MAKTKAKKKEDQRAEEIVPYQCYACSRYDGTFGPANDDRFIHVCEICKELPTSEDLAPIERHEAEFYAKEAEFDEESKLALACEGCGLEPDECRCSSRAQSRIERGPLVFSEEDIDQGIEEEVEEELKSINEEENKVEVLPEQRVEVKYEARIQFQPQEWVAIENNIGQYSVNAILPHNR